MNIQPIGLTKISRLLILVLLLTGLTSCQSTPQPTQPAQTTVAPSLSPSPLPSATVTPSVTVTATLQPTNTETPRPLPTDTVTPTQTLVPTLTLPPTATPPPGPLTLSVSNIRQIDQLAKWGKGTLITTAYSPDGRFFALATSLGVYLFNARTLQELRFINTGESADHIAFSPDSRILATANRNVRL